MSPKLKRGLHAGLSDIVSRQTAPAPDKSEESRRLITKFSDPPVPPESVPQRSTPQLSTPIQSIPPKSTYDFGGYYHTFNELSDRVIPEFKLNAYEQSVLHRLYRLSRGWRSAECSVGLGTLARFCNMARSQVQKSVAGLIEKGLIEQLGNSQMGTRYRVLPQFPTVPPPGKTKRETFAGAPAEPPPPPSDEDLQEYLRNRGMLSEVGDRSKK